MPLTQPNLTNPPSFGPPNKHVEVVRSLRRKLSHVPESVVEHFASQGKAVTLNSAHPDAIALYSGLYRFPVTADMLDEALISDLRMIGFQLGQDGTLKRGDCILLWVDEAHRDDLRAEAEMIWHEQGLRPHEEGVEAINEMAQRTTNRLVSVQRDPRSSREISQHVHHRGGR